MAARESARTQRHPGWLPVQERRLPGNAIATASASVAESSAVNIVSMDDGPSRRTGPSTPIHSAEATALTTLTWGYGTISRGLRLLRRPSCQQKGTRLSKSDEDPAGYHSPADIMSPP